MSELFIPRRFRDYNIVTKKELTTRPDAISIPDGKNESGKIVELDPTKNTKPKRNPSGKFDSYTFDTKYYMLVHIPPIKRKIENDDGDVEDRTIFTKIVSMVKMRWVSTDGKSWNRVYLYR